MVEYRITAEERTRFKRCRRQWDFASPHRRNLRPIGAVEPVLPAALKDALAVYYYPGTWDWQHEVTQPLAHKALERALADAGGTELLPRGAALLDCYDAWAHAVDDFAPVKINLDVEALVPDPDDVECGLVVHDGSPVIYACRIDLVAVDATDEYWVVCHQIVDEWQDVDRWDRDEQAVAACWAFEHDYIGVQVAGTIHNEVRIDGPLDVPAHRAGGETYAQSRRSTRGQRRWSIVPTTPTGFGAGNPRRCEDPNRAAHRWGVASYSHPPQPPRNHLGGNVDRRRGGGYDTLANHLPDVRRALSRLRIQGALFSDQRRV